MSEVLCAYCNRGPATVQDHVVPRSRGGPDRPWNLVMACVRCNSAKSDRLPSEWLGASAPESVRRIEESVSERVAVGHRARRGPHIQPGRDAGYERPAYRSETDPFDVWLSHSGKRAPDSVVDAAIYVHDTLEAAQRIALSTFGPRHQPDVVLRIYEAMERRIREERQK